MVDMSRQPPTDYAHEPQWIKQVVELVHSTAPGALRLSELAATVGVHPVHLARTFRRRHGCSIGAYARSLQIERAVTMLAGTAPLSEVALASGFYDQSHMGRAIRGATGKTPGQLRAAARG
jgi:AraC family transcriptional regulator